MTTLLVLALSLPQLLLVTVGIFAVLFGLAGALYAYALFRALSLLLKQRFRFSREQRIELADVPAHLPAAYATTVTALEALGFTPLGWSTSQRSPLFDDSPLTKCWLEHRDEAAYASVSFWASGMSPVVALTTFAVDAGGVFTMNGLRHTVLWDPKGVTFEDPYAPSLAAHWQAHVAAVRAAQLVVARLDFDAMLARVDGIDWGMNASAARPGTIADDRGVLRLTFGGAIAALRNLLAASKRARIATAAARRAQTSSPAAPPSTPAIAVPLPIEEEAAQLDRSLAHERAPMHLGIQLALLLPALAALFAVALLAGSPLDAVLILVALALHELGYYAALRLLGDTDTPRTWLPLIRHSCAPSGPGA